MIAGVGVAAAIVPAVISARNRKEKLAGIPAWIPLNIYELQIRSTRGFRQRTPLRIELIFPTGLLVRLTHLEDPDTNFFHLQVKTASDRLDAGQNATINFGNLACQASPVDTSQRLVKQKLVKQKQSRAGGMYGVFSDFCIFRHQGFNGCYALRFSTKDDLNTLISTGDINLF